MTREGPRVIIYRPWSKKHGSRDATAMVQLLKEARNEAGSAARTHFWLMRSELVASGTKRVF
jgi:hypothetical protein